MTDLRFDPSKAVTFDLAHGLVHLTGAPSRLIVPADALLTLARSAGPDATAAFGAAIGDAMGKRVAARLGEGGLGSAPVDVVVDHLGGELALAGLGSLGLERWGRAIVLVVDQSPLGGDGDRMLEATLASALGAASGKGVKVLAIARDAVRARFLVGNEAAIERVRRWIEEGLAWGDAIVRLHARVNVERGDA